MDTTIKQEYEVITFLESLVHKRFSEKQLSKVISDFFKENLEVYNATQNRINNADNDELADFNFMFNVIRKDKYELFGDVYMLPTREVVNEDKEFHTIWYVTEVGYEFC